MGGRREVVEFDEIRKVRVRVRKVYERDYVAKSELLTVADKANDQQNNGRKQDEEKTEKIKKGVADRGSQHIKTY